MAAPVFEEAMIDPPAAPEDGAAPVADSAAAAESLFRVQLYAVIARLLAHLDGPLHAESGKRWADAYPFLAAYGQMLAAHQPADLDGADAWRWWEAQAAAWLEADEARAAPLGLIVRSLDLAMSDLRVLLAAGLVEEDIRFGALFAALQEPLTARRPCVGLLGWLLAEPGGDPYDAWPAVQRLAGAALLSIDNQAEPRSEWVVRVPAPLWDALQGRRSAQPAPGLKLDAAATFPTPARLILPESLHGEVRALPNLLRRGQVSALVLRGMTGTGRRTVAGSVARALGRDLLCWQGKAPGDEAWRLLGPLATALGALPLLRFDPAPGETIDLPPLDGYRGPVAVTLGRSGGLRGDLLDRSLSLNLPPPDHDARRRFWQASGARVRAPALDDIAARFLLTGGHIHRAATLAETYAALDGRKSVVAEDVQRATRALNRQVLETLATPLETGAGWQDLIVTGAVARDLAALEARCRQREGLRMRAGAAFRGNLNRGVRAMFSGPSGTGKTLAARALAAALQMDLYRVDLAAVVNKYIGETEKNLNQVLARAEELDVVLLLDEGDALMAKRTDVRNANDRYANLETNYLLQRLENYEGIVIVTTNAGQRIDEAFLRRLDVIVDFAPPDAAERRAIWLLHLPAEHVVSDSFLDDIAARCVLTGGQIRNAALHALLLAGSDAAVSEADVEAAVQREYRKAGAAYPLRANRAPNGQLGRLQQFAAEIG